MNKTVAPPTKEWTFLFYNAGSRDQSKMCASIIRDLESVGSNADVDLVCLNERWAWSPDKFGPCKKNQGTKLYHLQKDPKAGRAKGEFSRLWKFVTAAPRKFFNRPEKDELSKLHLGQADSLRQFLDLAIERYPARHYALVLNAHGAGFDGQSVMHAQGDIKSSRITNQELGQVLAEFADKTGKKMDLVNLNTCLGAGLETMSPLAQGAEVTVASSGVVFAGTQPFGAVIDKVQQQLAQGQSISPQQLGRLFVEEAADQPISNLFTGTLSAVQLDQVSGLTASIASLHQSLIQENVPAATVRTALEEAVQFSYSQHERPIFLTDIGSLAHQLQGKLTPDSASWRDCQNIRQQLQECILAEEHQDRSKETLLTSILRKPLSKMTGSILRPEEFQNYSGLTIHYDPEPNGPNNRTDKLVTTDLGRQLGLEKFLSYLGEEPLQTGGSPK